MIVELLPFPPSVAPIIPFVDLLFVVLEAKSASGGDDKCSASFLFTPIPFNPRALPYLSSGFTSHCLTHPLPPLPATALDTHLPPLCYRRFAVLRYESKTFYFPFFTRNRWRGFCVEGGALPFEGSFVFCFLLVSRAWLPFFFFILPFCFLA